jgi:hypothetical protein
MVAVDYEDLIEVTLPYNRHHFDEMHIVTNVGGTRKIAEAVQSDRVVVHETDLFYADGATFNKWRALEWGLDQMGRHGWMCLMDADVLWPKEAEVIADGDTILFRTNVDRGVRVTQLVKKGCIISPLRRMVPWPCVDPKIQSLGFIPPEFDWQRYTIHRNINEWAGYSQVFHADDPHLGTPPWHEVDWKHAGGADSLFQRKWPKECKVRPSWEVLHLGEAGANWYGRATPMADGSIPKRAEELKAQVAEIWRGRRAIRAEGGGEAEQFAPERIRPTE